MQTKEAITKDKEDRDLLDDIISWEDEDMTDEDEIKFFQKLIDNGMAWTLQGMYGRTAMSLIEAGLCHRKKD